MCIAPSPIRRRPDKRMGNPLAKNITNQPEIPNSFLKYLVPNPKKYSTLQKSKINPYIYVCKHYLPTDENYQLSNHHSQFPSKDFSYDSAANHGYHGRYLHQGN